MYLGQLGRYISASRFQRKGKLVSWQTDSAEGEGKKTNRREIPLWFCDAASSGLAALDTRDRQTLQDTLFISSKESQVIVRYSDDLYEALSDRSRLKQFEDDKGRSFQITEFSDYLEGRTYIAMRLERSLIGSSPETSSLLTESGDFFITQDGFNISI